MPNPSVDPILHTRHGSVRGRLEDGLRVFRGIPYAAPPVGPRRWRAPAPPEPWTGVRDAGAFAAPAPQNDGMLSRMLGARREGASEDCLTLNVWAPAGDGEAHPVMVWLHGGGFTTGSGADHVYDGAALARRGDVVVVTVNYRLGALGWLALPALAQEEGGPIGNFGLLDQIAALEWVRDHAAALGGDPDRVTVFGESAGAMSVGTLLGCPRARGLFSRAILQSGAAHNVSPLERGELVLDVFCRELGVAADDTAALRAMPVERLLAAQASVSQKRVEGLGTALRFQPTLDGGVLPRSPLAAVAAGEAAGVRLLVGTNLDESKLWALADPKAAGLDDDALLRRCRRTIPGRHDDGREHGERAIEWYRKARDGRAPIDPRELWFAIESDRTFRIPASRLLDAQAPHADVFAYLFTWASPAMGGAIGACHALEVPFVFGGVDGPVIRDLVGDLDEARRLSERMQDAWLAFARDGEPAHDPDWPRHGAGRETLRLDRDSVVEAAPLERERRFWEGIL